MQESIIYSCIRSCHTWNHCNYLPVCRRLCYVSLFLYNLFIKYHKRFYDLPLPVVGYYPLVSIKYVKYWGHYCTYVNMKSYHENGRHKKHWLSSIKPTKSERKRVCSWAPHRPGVPLRCQTMTNPLPLLP